MDNVFIGVQLWQSTRTVTNRQLQIIPSNSTYLIDNYTCMYSTITKFDNTDITLNISISAPTYPWDPAVLTYSSDSDMSYICTIDIEIPIRSKIDNTIVYAPFKYTVYG